MNSTNQAMDEYTLAAFMAGTLSQSRREEVALYLSNNADARELLQMAYEALEASQVQDDDFGLPELESASAPVANTRPDRKPTQLRRKMNGVTRFLTAAVFVFAVGVGLRLSLGPPADALRSRQADDLLALSVQTEREGPIVHWNQLPDAYQYRVVVWDPQEAEVVGRHETSSTRLDSQDAFMQAIRGQAATGRAYTVRVDAYDVQNRLIQTSETIEVNLVN